MNFENNLLKRAENAEKIISEYMPVPGKFDGAIVEAMNYSVMTGGKRLRPVLMESFYRLFGGVSDVVKPCMAAMEMLHSYTLVHDDLPALDNDDMLLELWFGRRRCTYTDSYSYPQTGRETF